MGKHSQPQKGQSSNQPTPQKKVAWRVTITTNAWRNFESIVITTCRDEALDLSYRGSQEVGYKLRRKHFRARRAPRYDEAASRADPMTRYLGWRDGLICEGVLRLTERERGIREEAQDHHII